MIKFDFKKYKYVVVHLAHMIVLQNNMNVIQYIIAYLYANHIYISKRLITNSIMNPKNHNKLSNLIFMWFYCKYNSKVNVSFR